MVAGFFEVPASLLAWFYGFTHSYALAIALIAVVVMALITPLTLKSTKGMLEMQRLAPEMRKLQAQHRNDRQKLNEEMMKLYQEHKVNPMASCLPLLAQMPVFIIMFRIIHGLTYEPSGSTGVIARATLAAADSRPAEVGFLPRYLSVDSDLWQGLAREQKMESFKLDLAKSAASALTDGLGTGLPYVLLVVALAGLYFLQQRMVAARAAVSPTMSPAQQKIMQYLPVAFAIFQVFFLAGLVIYYIAQAILRIGQQAYITRAFYGHEEALGRQAQRAGERARELAKEDGGGGGLFSQARQQIADAKGDGASPKATKPSKPTRPTKPARGGKSAGQAGEAGTSPSGGTASKRTTPPKQRPTPTSKASRGRPTSRSSKRPSGGKKRR
jgi:YidC/Oxa1 family membrane protein insertase